MKYYINVAPPVTLLKHSTVSVLYATGLTLSVCLSF